MIDSRSKLYTTAKLFSVAGNPLITSTLIIGVACIRLLDGLHALAILAALVLCVIVPIVWWNHRGVRSGQYSDFDVSRREDRNTMYPLLVFLPLIGSAVLGAAQQPRALTCGLLAASLMSLAASLINRWIKISLHAAFSFFFAVGSAALTWRMVAPLTIFAILVTISRWIIGRHVWRELVLGTLLGVFAGSALLKTIGVL